MNLKARAASVTNNLTAMPGLLLLAMSIIINLFVYKDYGVSWDEPNQREIGMTTFKYLIHGDQSLKTYLEKDHGVGMELPLVAIEKLLQLNDSRDIYLMRHLATNIFFLFAVFCGYLLTLRLFRNQWIAVLFFLLLAFHPRLYAHSYFNSKDIPFLSFFIICFSIAEISFRKMKWPWHLALGVACGYATSIRILALILPFCFGLFYFIDAIGSGKDRKALKKPCSMALVFIIGYIITLYASWPILWSDPIHQLTDNFKSMAHFRWDGYVLFFGKMEACRNLPWTYIPGWCAISIPELWVIVGGIAVLVLITKVSTSTKIYLANTRERNFTLYLLCFLLPVFAIILLNSVLLDGWRHMYFIYPSFILVMLYFLNWLGKTKIKFAVVLLCIVQLSNTAYFMIKNHPFQQVYFNHFVSHDKEFLRKNFDLEYWGCSMKQGYEYLLKQDSLSPIKTWRHIDPVFNNSLILKKEDRKRIMIEDDKDEAEYFMTIFRDHPDDYPEKGPVVHEIKVLNSTILRVQKMTKAQP